MEGEGSAPAGEKRDEGLLRGIRPFVFSFPFQQGEGDDHAVAGDEQEGGKGHGQEAVHRGDAETDVTQTDDAEAGVEQPPVPLRVRKGLREERPSTGLPAGGAGRSVRLSVHKEG